jgi:hypothetical protein
VIVTRRRAKQRRRRHLLPKRTFQISHLSNRRTTTCKADEDLQLEVLEAAT